jgi:hypothetical protein
MSLKNLLTSNFFKKLFALLALLSMCLLNNCRLPDSFGFYHPITLSLVVPDGPPEFKAGWYSGCRSGLGARGTSSFGNAGVYIKDIADMGNGVYQHDPSFQTGWGVGWYTCVIHANTFTSMNSMKYSPLGK